MSIISYRYEIFLDIYGFKLGERCEQPCAKPIRADWMRWEFWDGYVVWATHQRICWDWGMDIPFCHYETYGRKLGNHGNSRTSALFNAEKTSVRFTGRWNRHVTVTGNSQVVKSMSRPVGSWKDGLKELRITGILPWVNVIKEPHCSTEPWESLVNKGHHPLLWP